MQNISFCNHAKRNVNFSFCNLQNVLYHFSQFGSHASQGPPESKMLKCHCCHGDFSGVPNSFGNHVTNIEFFFAKLPKISQKFGYVTATLGGH